MDDTTLLKTVGQAIWGQSWQQPMARHLVVNDRSMRDWLAHGRLPPGVKNELILIARRRAADMTRRAMILQQAALDAAAGEGFQTHVHVVPGEHQNAQPVMLYDDFNVIPTGVWDDPEIRFKADGQLVLATVTREAWEDFFRMPGGELRSSNDARLLAQANLPRLVSVLIERYSRHDYQMINRAGGTYPLIVLQEEDLKRAGPGMTKDLLAAARNSTFHLRD